MKKQRSLRSRIFGSHFLNLTFTFLLLAVLSYSTLRNSLLSRSFDQLVSVRDLMKDQVEKYLNDKEEALRSLAESGTFKELLWKGDRERLRELLALSLHSQDFEDVFITDSKGSVVFSVQPKTLIPGDFEAFKTAKAGLIFRDFTPHPARQGVAIAYLAMPVRIAGRSWVLTMAFSNGQLSRLLKHRYGLGQTGESYLVGPDFRFRTESRFIERAVFKGTEVRTPSAEEGLAGKTETRLIHDYRDVPVLSSFTPVSSRLVKWVLIAELDQAEVFEPIYQISLSLLCLFLLIFLFIAFLSHRFAMVLQRERISDILEGQESESARIGQELHDGLGQSLVAIRLKVEKLDHASELEDEKVEIAAMIGDCSSEIQAICKRVSPRILRDFGLYYALKRLCDHASAVSSTRFHWSYQEESNRKLPMELALNCFRIAQEGVANVLKHAQAQDAWLSLTVRDRQILLDLRDNGRGFEGESQGNGLPNIRNRVFAFGGDLRFNSNLNGGGTSIHATIPW